MRVRGADLAAGKISRSSLRAPESAPANTRHQGFLSPVSVTKCCARGIFGAYAHDKPSAAHHVSSMPSIELSVTVGGTRMSKPAMAFVGMTLRL